MADDAEVCGCNGISKGRIVNAIKAKGLFTLEDVRKHTKASSSCGSCTGLVEQLLACTVGEDYSEPPKKKHVCGCTERTHAEVREAIRKHKLLTIADVYAFCDWRSLDGCATCRPAVNYYLISTWPHEAKDDPQSRSSTSARTRTSRRTEPSRSCRACGAARPTPPSCAGSPTSSTSTRIPTVKVTGGQRIDLLGVKKQDLPAVWRDLDMPSGHAYAKALRTVKTCVGSEWCRYGTQDSTAMGKALERALWRMYAPHKVKLAVSGCPRNCAESGIKDVGVIAVESGWELYVAGNGGIKTEVAQFLVKVQTASEVLEYAGAFLELYRRKASTSSAPCISLRASGSTTSRAAIVEDASGRRALWEQLQFALADEPDPWHQPRDRRSVRPPANTRPLTVA